MGPWYNCPRSNTPKTHINPTKHNPYTQGDDIENYHLHLIFWRTCAAMFTSIVQSMSTGFFFLKINISSTFPLNFDRLLRGTIPELISLANCEFTARLVEARSTETVNFFVLRNWAFDLGITALPTSVSP